MPDLTGVSRERDAFLGWHRAALRLGDGAEAAHALLELSAHYDYTADVVDTAQRHATSALRRLATLAAGQCKDESPLRHSKAAAAAAAKVGEHTLGWSKYDAETSPMKAAEMAWAFYTRLWEADLVAPVRVAIIMWFRGSCDIHLTSCAWVGNRVAHASPMRLTQKLCENCSALTPTCLVSMTTTAIN